MLFVEKWMKLETITLNEISQTQKDKCHVLPPKQGLDEKKDMKVDGGSFGREGPW
jgi:hypothetical protein